MNTKTPYILLLATFLLTGVAVIPSTEASEKAPIEIPTTIAAIWQAIDQQSAELAKLIQAGTLGDVHHHAFAIRDLSAALPTHAEQLSAEQRKQVELQVKFVVTLTQRLDASGDSNDRAGAESNFGKLQVVLSTLRKASITNGEK